MIKTFKFWIEKVIVPIACALIGAFASYLVCKIQHPSPADVTTIQNKIDKTGKAEHTLQSIPLDVTGNWVYVAKSKLPFTEDTCKIRMGTVFISAQGDSNQLNIAGKRLLEEECCCPPNSTRRNVVVWESVFAVTSVNAAKMFLWLQTFDPVPRYAFVSAAIIKNKMEINPTCMQGKMYYLEDSKKTWLKADITFYREESQEAKRINKKWR